MKIITNIIITMAIAACVVITGCQTTDISEQPQILIPSSLTKEEVKEAILKAVPVPPQELTPGQKMTDNALRAGLGLAYKKADKRRLEGHWYIEDIRENSVLIGHDRREFYLRIEYIIQGNQLIERIDGSRNLSQTENSIHKIAYQWMKEMETYIRQSMGEAATEKFGKQRSTSSSNDR